MPTHLLYLHPSPPLFCTARVLDVGQDNLGLYLILDQTTAYVRGGGQLGDRGSVGSATLVDVRRADDQIRHYIEGVSPAIGEAVEVQVDAGFRSMNTRLHTAGHLLAAIVEHQVPGFIASAAQQWPTDAWVAGNWNASTVDDLVVRLQRFVEEAIKADLSVVVKPGEVRTVTIAGHRPVPCGGTHTTSTGAIGFLRVEEARIKKGVLKVRYAIDEAKGA